MIIIIEYIFINPNLNEIKFIIINNMKDYIKKHGNSYWKRFENIYDIRFMTK